MPQPFDAPPRRRLVPRLLALIPTLLLLVLVGWVALFVVFAPKMPDTAELFRDSEQATVTLLAADGSVLAERGATGRRFVPLKEISPLLVKAVLAIEDTRFYRHFGVDPWGLGRAVLANFKAGDVVAGGSTITQQLAKNLYLTPERSLRRKLEELTLALWLEARLSKDQILELYLNRVYLGAGAYGVEAAAQRYFGKSAGEVNLAEAALLAGLLKAPSALAPTNDLDRARLRANVVLGRMAETGAITDDQAVAARARPARLAPEGKTDLAGWFVDWVLDGLTEHLGKPERDLTVRTTLDRDLQAKAEATVRTMLETEGERREASEGAAVLLDESGAVKALVGGRSYRTNRYNRAVAARRQPGSAFKPFVYLAALQQGWTPESRLDDRPISIKGWSPANIDGKYHGQVTMTEAFARSLNAATVQLGQKVGVERVVKTARRLGIASELQPVPSLALGTSEVTLLELTGAYLPFATGGVLRPVHAVAEVKDDRGRTLYRHTPTEARVVEAKTAGAMQQLMLRVVEDGTGKAADLGARLAAGKTGTTQSSRDAWFVGWSGEHVLGVWVGNDDNAPMKGVTGGTLPARIWHDIMIATPRQPAVARAPASSSGTAVPTAQRNIPEELAQKGLDWLHRLVEDALGATR